MSPSAKAAKTDNPLNPNGGAGPRSKGWRLPAHEIERLVLKQVILFLKDRSALLDALRVIHESPDAVSAVLAHTSKLAQACETASPKIQADLVTTLIQRVTVAPDKVTIEIARKALAASLLDQEADKASASTRGDPVAIDVPVSLRRRGVEAKLVAPNLTDAASDPDPSLVKLLARAHEWFSRILRGEVKDFQEIATAEKLNRSYVTRAVSLAFLPPATAKAILEGRQPPELTAKRLLRCAHNLPLAWADESLFGTDE